jgi:hypothetical protein
VHGGRTLGAMTRLGWVIAFVSAGVALGGVGGGIYAVGQMSGQAARPSSVAQVSNGPQPKTVEAAKSAAQASFDLYAAGDWRGSWDSWTASAKKVVSRDEYARYHEECPQAVTGPAFTITSIRLETPTTATLVVDRMGFKFTYQMIYEDGQWRFQPDADTIKDFKGGVDKMIADCKK